MSNTPETKEVAVQKPTKEKKIGNPPVTVEELRKILES